MLQPTADFRTLAGWVQGSLLTPVHDDWDSRPAIWNGRLDHAPSAILRCSDPDDVRAALGFARDEELAVILRSGGHSYAGHSAREDGLVLDLSALADVAVDPKARTVRVGPGATWGEVDRATQEVGLATTGSTVSTVGVAGYTLGGGTGHLARKVGLSVDNLRSAELVTPDRGRVRASATENPDLFWALRGGGGNFGVVTAFEFALHEVGPRVLAGQTVYPFDAASTVLRGYRDAMADAPDELACYAFVFNVPPSPPFPEEHQGSPAVSMVLVWTGEISAGEAWTRPFRTLAKPILDAVEPRPYMEVQKTFDAGVPKGLRWFSRAHCLADLPDDVLDLVVEHCRRLPGAYSMVYLEPLGGAIAGVDPTATAFPHRRASFSLHILPGWNDPGQDEELTAWARTFHSEVAPHATGGVYVNLLGEDEEHRVPAAYGVNLGRLREAKRAWDGRNLLRTNHNIDPATGGDEAPARS